MFGSRKSLPLFLLFVTLILIISGLCLPLCLAQEGEEPPAEEEKPILEQLQEDLDEYLGLMSNEEFDLAFEKLEEYLAALKELAEDPAALSETEAHAVHVLYVTSKHLAVLMRVYEKVPEAAGGITNALVKSTRGHANAYRLADKAEDDQADEGGEEVGKTGSSQNGNSSNGQGQGQGKGKKSKE